MKCLENLKQGWSKICRNHKWFKPGLEFTKLLLSSDGNTLNQSRNSLFFLSLDCGCRSEEGEQLQKELCGLHQS